MNGMNVFLLIIATVAVILIDWPEVRQAHTKKQMIVYLSVLGIGVTLAFLHLLDIPLFNPTNMIVWLFRPLVG